MICIILLVYRSILHRLLLLAPASLATREGRQTRWARREGRQSWQTVPVAISPDSGGGRRHSMGGQHFYTYNTANNLML